MKNGKTIMNKCQDKYILRLQGGIGNQLFQYWAGYFKSQVNERMLCIDTGEYKSNFDFTLMKEIAKEAEFVCLEASKSQRILQRYFKLPYLQGMRIYHEKKLVYDPKFWAHSKTTQIIKGYFQSFKYFLDTDRVVNETTRALSQSVGEFNKSILQENNDLVSVHIRRGDYVHNVQALSYHGICSDSYYMNAINLIKSLKESAKFVVFTNDLPYAKKLFSGESVYFANELFKTSSDREEMYLMSKCKCNIISNSSFSWWSAYLNQSLDKIVIAPHEWYTFPYNNKDLLPSNWLQIPR